MRQQQGCCIPFRQGVRNDGATPLTRVRWEDDLPRATLFPDAHQTLRGDRCFCFQERSEHRARPQRLCRIDNRARHVRSQVLRWPAGESDAASAHRIRRLARLHRRHKERSVLPPGNEGLDRRESTQGMRSRPRCQQGRSRHEPPRNRARPNQEPHIVSIRRAPGPAQ